tara:strand:+ start:414 stop:521 length:108 start_codon:yes stop_codon:yes gene_type:complete
MTFEIWIAILFGLKAILIILAFYFGYKFMTRKKKK